MKRYFLFRSLVFSVIAISSFCFNTKYLNRTSIPTNYAKRDNDLRLNSAPNSNVFDMVYSSKRINVIECDDGYVDMQYNIYDIEFTSQSRLNLLEFNLNFVPGHVARENNEKQTNGKEFKDYSLKSGYFHIYTKHREKELDQSLTVHSAFPFFIEAFPNSSTKSYAMLETKTNCEITLSQTKGGEIGIDGFSLKYESEQGFNIGYEKSVTSISQDPMISFQFSPNIKEQAEWNYEILGPDVAGKKTFNFTCYYLLELDNNVHQSLQNTFDIYYEANYQGQYYSWFAWRDGWDFNKSGSIRVRY